MEESTLKFTNKCMSEMLEIMNNNNRIPTNEDIGIEFSCGWESGYIQTMNKIKENILSHAEK